MSRRHVATRSNSIWESHEKVYWENHEKSVLEKQQALQPPTRWWWWILVGIVIIMGSVLVMMNQPNSITQDTVVVVTPVPVSNAVREKCKSESKTGNWHKNSCTNICISYTALKPRPLVHRSCSDGCNYGTITATNIGCDYGTGKATEQCPKAVDCAHACRTYDEQLPRPTLKNNCQKSCIMIAQDSCKRALTILHKLHTEEILSSSQEKL